MLTYRLPLGKDSPLRHQKLGNIMGKSARKELKEYLQDKFGGDALSPAAINQFMASQSRDLLFCLRCSNLVRGMNRDLGGSTLDRFIAFGSAASRGSALTIDEHSLSTKSTRILTREETDTLTTSSTDLLETAKASLNQPVASELFARRRSHQGIVSPNKILLPYSMSDFIRSYHMSMRTWWKGFFVDLFIFLTGVSTDMSPKRFG